MARAVVWVLFALAFPVGSAATSFEADDVLPVNLLYRNSWAAGPAVDYVLRLQPGDVVDAVLSWTDPNARLLLVIWGESSPPCEPGLGCVLKGSPDCSATSGPLVGETQHARLVAHAEEEFRVHVGAKFAAFEVAYHVSIQVNGGVADVVEVRDGFYAFTATTAPCSLST